MLVVRDSSIRVTALSRSVSLAPRFAPCTSDLVSFMPESVHKMILGALGTSESRSFAGLGPTPKSRARSSDNRSMAITVRPPCGGHSEGTCRARGSARRARRPLRPSRSARS